MSSVAETHKVIEIKKYQNRRYYDTTNSQHLSLEKIHKLVGDGSDIKVIDAKSGTDITNKILTQIILEYEPMKLDFFSSSLLMQVIRRNDSLLKDFYEVYVNKVLQSYGHSRERFQGVMDQMQSLPIPGTRNPFSSWFGMTPSTQSEEPLDSPNEELKEMREELDELKELLKTKV